MEGESVIQQKIYTGEHLLVGQDEAIMLALRPGAPFSKITVGRTGCDACCMWWQIPGTKRDIVVLSHFYSTTWDDHLSAYGKIIAGLYDGPQEHGTPLFLGGVGVSAAFFEEQAFLMVKLQHQRLDNLFILQQVAALGDQLLEKIGKSKQQLFLPGESGLGTNSDSLRVGMARLARRDEITWRLIPLTTPILTKMVSNGHFQLGVERKVIKSRDGRKLKSKVTQQIFINGTPFRIQIPTSNQ